MRLRAGIQAIWLRVRHYRRSTVVVAIATLGALLYLNATMIFYERRSVPQFLVTCGNNCSNDPDSVAQRQALWDAFNGRNGWVVTSQAGRDGLTIYQIRRWRFSSPITNAAEAASAQEHLRAQATITSATAVVVAAVTATAATAHAATSLAKARALGTRQACLEEDQDRRRAMGSRVDPVSGVDRCRVR